MTAAMIASRATGKGPGGKGDWGMETSLESFDVVPGLLVSSHREKLYPILVKFLTAFLGRKRTNTRLEIQRSCNGTKSPPTQAASCSAINPRMYFRFRRISSSTEVGLSVSSCAHLLKPISASASITALKSILPSPR